MTASVQVQFDVRQSFGKLVNEFTSRIHLLKECLLVCLELLRKKVLYRYDGANSNAPYEDIGPMVEMALVFLISDNCPEFHAIDANRFVRCI